MSFTTQATPDVSFDKFPEWECPLSQFEQRGAALALADGAQAKLLMDTIKKRQFMDPSLSSLIEIAKQRGDKAKLVGGLYLPYEFNRLRSEDAPDLFLDATPVHTEEQDFVLTGCPASPPQATELFMNLLEHQATKRVWVSLIDSSERPDLCNGFWQPEFVKTLPLRKGWRLIDSSTQPLAQGHELSAIGTPTTLSKTTLVFSNGIETKTLNHLHFNGWIDHQKCPDEGLFMRLIHEMDELNKQEERSLSPARVPIVINCIGGVGRTGMTTVGYWCHRKISACPREQLSVLTLNIPEMIYSLKKQRFNTAEKDVHLIALHSFFGKSFSENVSLASR